jgi:hypothetical protein
VSSAAAAEPAQAAPLTPLQIAVACAITPDATPGDAHPPVVVGSQDTSLRSLFGPRDLLVVNGGTAKNVQIGERYFIRSGDWFHPRHTNQPRELQTSGWATIVAANDATAIAQVDYACGGVRTGDFLEPFVAPEVPANAERTSSEGTLDFTDLGRVLYGEHLRWTSATGAFMLVDRGTETGATVGARYAVYRDLRRDGVPLTEIGEAVVVSAARSTAVVRITASRDAVTAGDYIVPRR